MELRDYLRAVRKRWWLVAGAVVVALGVATLITALTPPKYAASATFFVGTQTNGVSDAYQGSLFSQQRIKSYADLLASDRLAQAIVDDDSMGLSADQVRGKITATAIPDTVLLEATVTDGNRARALRLTQSMARQFVKLVEDLETPPGGEVPTVWIEVVGDPRLADAPVSPTPLRNAGLALALGLVIGVGGAVLRETLDTSVKTPQALGEITDAPVLSAVPMDSRAKRAPLIIAGSAGSVRAEALRQLRTNLQFVNVDQPARAVAVTSAVPGEGKSTTACNLAIVFAEAGKRVVLVDADLRRPKLAEYLGVEGALGLTNVLAGQASLDDALQQWGSSGVFVLPSGSIPPNPSELLGSRNMAALVASLRRGFDMVIIDTPPLLPVTDAALAATIVDGTMLVFRCGKTTATQARSAIDALTAVDARVLGCVLNMTPRKGEGTYSYYDYQPNAKHVQPAVEHRASVPAQQPVPVVYQTAAVAAGTPSSGAPVSGANGTNGSHGAAAPSSPAAAGAGGAGRNGNGNGGREYGRATGVAAVPMLDLGDDETSAIGVARVRDSR
jgi:capsular exopolysaccharide synthesis family protein